MGIHYCIHIITYFYSYNPIQSLYFSLSFGLQDVAIYKTSSFLSFSKKSTRPTRKQRTQRRRSPPSSSSQPTNLQVFQELFYHKQRAMYIKLRHIHTPIVSATTDVIRQ